MKLTAEHPVISTALSPVTMKRSYMAWFGILGIGVVAGLIAVA